MRLYRDIPANEIEAGSKSSHLRQIVSAKLKNLGLKCACIRCREIKDEPQEKKLFLRRTNYSASFGQEIFLEFVDKFDRIYGLLRLRIPKFSFTPSRCKLKLFLNSPTLSILKKAGIVRELHIFGQSLKIKAPTPDRKNETIVQHRGLGKKLLAEAERIVREEYKLPKIAIISGVGVREYYRSLGYELKDEYMVKKV